ncbi:type I phosphoribosyltransferase [Saccharibacillus alkalitolerans]|uniref:Phosphoribosyltransferase domain-containing protein n=1 Tax=Saccharibacillus alkalitolerans TaxID=2705290 RepID=A0ABX0FBB5_9BACL|nr:hypothetical protein [Saccharibacillus alkalitolerans]NGZ76526.1 hypothetical protein [Saccharibacillus alkalitolerans]
MSPFWSWCFAVLSVVGVGLTIYYGIKSTKLEKKRVRLDWAEVQACTTDLHRQLKKTFDPELILATDLRGATISNLILQNFDYPVPTFTGMTFLKDQQKSDIELKGYFQIPTHKWDVFLPENLFQFTSKRLLIVDDFAMSGDYLKKLKEVLIEKGFNKEDIKTLCIATTKVAIKSQKAPDYYWLESDDDDFYFPWGKAK